MNQNQNASIVIYGPAASGKTRYASEFAKHYGLNTIVDDASFDPKRNTYQTRGVLYLAETPGASLTSIHIDDALAAIGKEPIRRSNA